MFKLFTDGGSRGNPGKAASGAFLFDENNNLIESGGEFLGIATNNVAEYKALIYGLQMALKSKIKTITCHLDSELVVKQLNGQYKVKHPDMIDLFKNVNELASNFDKCEFVHIRREFNKFADKMVNTILDSTN